MKKIKLLILLAAIIAVVASSCQEEPQPIKPREFSFWVEPLERGQEITIRWGANELQDADHTRGGIGFGSAVSCLPGQRMAFQVTADALIDITKNHSPLDSTRTFAIKAGEVLKIDTW